MYWGHKASIIGLPKQGVVIDAVAVMDAATHDGQTFYVSAGLTTVLHVNSSGLCLLSP